MLRYRTATFAADWRKREVGCWLVVSAVPTLSLSLTCPSYDSAERIRKETQLLLLVRKILHYDWIRKKMFRAFNAFASGITTRSDNSDGKVCTFFFSSTDIFRSHEFIHFSIFHILHQMDICDHNLPPHLHPSMKHEIIIIRCEM